MPAINGRGISIGVGSFDGESAFAVGFQIQSDMASFKVGVTSAGGETGASGWCGLPVLSAELKVLQRTTGGPRNWAAGFHLCQDGTNASLERTTMTRLPAATVALFLLSASPATDAQTLDQGVAKFQGGDFTGALGDLMPFAEGGNSIAQMFVAIMYSNGLGAVQDNVSAVNWLYRAAEQEHAEAQYFLAQTGGEGTGRRAGLRRGRAVV